ncbi:hypothetical protein [Bythopirellula goksoeyrii]|uniref:Uncharacterized protein n=1 Tax=Bythopirellula goksoeyrii TaxID=1400387 RepID=A0A5B9QCD7_9BACT|nr:hypothetical protein [Bythopirellula goksoeyrii]QEG35255.1 hypothetical protein Pr1d_25500 [Bythopirellula goksoeyrii]
MHNSTNTNLAISQLKSTSASELIAHCDFLEQGIFVCRNCKHWIPGQLEESLLGWLKTQGMTKTELEAKLRELSSLLKLAAEVHECESAGTFGRLRWTPWNKLLTDLAVSKAAAELRAKLASEVLDIGIPAGARPIIWSRPMSKKDAAKLLGCPHTKKADWLNSCINSGLYRIRSINRQSIQFDMETVPAELREKFQLMPN